jgi:phosphoglycerate dehydrogenase-like enzyme
MTFKVGLSADLNKGDGKFTWGDINIETLAPLNWEFVTQNEKNFTPEMVKGFDAIAFAGPGVIPGSFGAPDDSPLIIARFGVGYDNIDLAECTRAGVALTITPDGSQKPVATAALTLMLATLHRLNAKGIVARENRWSDRLDKLGTSPNGKTVATIGLGNIASEFFRLLAPFDCKRISYDPWKTQDDGDKIGVKLVDLETIYAEADVIIVMATLTPDTQHLISTKEFEAMKNSAIIVNISRGPIIDEAALIEALQKGEIAGAGLDVFEKEPPASDNALLAMSNVVVTPHNIAWTDELAAGMGTSAFTAIKAIASGEHPKFVVNKEVLDTPQFKNKLAKWL